MPLLKSVSLKLIKTVLLTVAVTLALGVTYFFYVERREYTDTLRNEAFQDSSIIMTSLEHAMTDNLNNHGAGRDTHHTQDIMKTLAGTNLVHSLLITDPTGQIDIASEPSLQGTFFSTGGAICLRCHTQTPRPRQLVDSYRQANGEEVLRSVIPIFNKPGCDTCHQERVLGLMVNDLHTDNMRTHARLQSRRFIFLALAIFSVITFSLVLQVNRIIRKPVQALVRAHQALAGGDYKANVSLQPDDEMGYLAESFNQMADRIKDSHAALERWNLALEEQVARRTAELSATNQLLSKEKRHSESMARSIVEGVLSVDSDGKIDMLNIPVTKILGRSDVQAAGMPLEEAVKAAASQFNRPGEFEDLILEKGKKTDGYLGIIEQIQPERRTFKVSGNRIVGPEGEDSGRVFTFHDITREREIDEIKTNLLAMVSHELRTPLTSIKGAITLLAEGRVNEIEKKEFLTIALANTERLVDLINNLLDLGKIESGRVFYDHGTFFIRPMLEESLQEVSAVAARHGVNVVLDVPETIGDATGDASKIEQVVVNLISNAIKFSPGGKEIRVSVEQGRGEYTFTVIDHGIGIPDGEKTRIFDKFYQVDMSSVRSTGGSGLGLTISKAIIEGHGGRIWVEDTPGGGSTFRFTLPREMAAQVAHRESAAPEVVSGHRIAQRVLVVEDEEAVRKILSRVPAGERYRGPPGRHGPGGPETCPDRSP